MKKVSMKKVSMKKVRFSLDATNILADDILSKWKIPNDQKTNFLEAFAKARENVAPKNKDWADAISREELMAVYPNFFCEEKKLKEKALQETKVDPEDRCPLAKALKPIKSVRQRNVSQQPITFDYSIYNRPKIDFSKGSLARARNRMKKKTAARTQESALQTSNSK